MNRKIFDAIKKFNMLSPGDSVVVGVSGGADSVCLLHFLTTFRGKYDIIIKAVHVNHNIRGKEAERDERFVQNLCKNLGVKLEIVSKDVPLLCRQLSIGEEECGRIVRYDAFNAANCSKIAVAHTASDNAETVLFNLARGSSLKGASGINPKNGNIIRPLIFLSRAEVEQYCKDNDLDYVTDSTNLSDEYTRNKIRLNVVPQLKHINSSFEQNILRFCLNSRQEDDFLNHLASNALQEAEISKNIFDYNKLIQNDDVILRRCICILLEQNNFNISSKMVDLCFNALKNKSRQQISNDVFFAVSRGQLQIKQQVKNPQFWQTKAHLGMNEYPYGVIELRLVDVGHPLISNFNAFDADRLDLNDLILRGRLPSDKITDGVRKVSKSVKKLFAESKIPVEERTKIPLLCFKDDIIWVKGYRINQKYQLDSLSKRAIIIKEI